MKLKKVINLYGGPGCGKSTISSGLFYRMKSEGYNVEYVSEYAKDLTYEERYGILQQDQLYILAKQHRKVFRLKDKVDYVISDSPLLLPYVYYELYSDTQIYDRESFTNLVISIYDLYPNLNILLYRNDKYDYARYGRTQSLEDSKKIDKEIKEILSRVCKNFTAMLSDENTINKILKEIENGF